jgi:hypothetical protein
MLLIWHPMYCNSYVHKPSGYHLQNWQLGLAQRSSRSLAFEITHALKSLRCRLFEASLSDLASVKVLSEENRGYVIRLRGLPYSSKPSNIISFLGPVEVLGNEDGVVFTYQADGRPTGEAYVELPSEDAAQQAMKKHKQTLGSR